MRTDILSQDYLKSILNYNPETGEFTWKIDTCRRRKGQRAGGVSKYDSHGRVRITIGIDGNRYHAAGLAWLYEYGEHPTGVIDHKDGDATNNKIANLRHCTHQQNMWNSRKAVNNKSGYKGVSWSGATNKWLARIYYKGQSIHLGVHETKEAAYAAYCSKAQELFGEYARLK